VYKNTNEGGLLVNSEKILSSIPKLQKLDDKNINLVSSVIDSFLAVQAVEQACKNPLALQKLVASMKI